MLSRSRYVQLSKLLALMLRHQPQRFGLTLDAEGYAALAEVLDAVRGQLPGVSSEDLLHVVERLDPTKRRFSILDGDIRANYGHSLAERIAHASAVPPPVLLHGTSQRALAGIYELGILPRQRQYVHLTTDRDLATRIGGRHGIAQVLSIDAARAHLEGLKFYRANESFWLADEIPARYIAKENS